MNNDIKLPGTPSLTISRQVIADFEKAFKNLRPSITTQGNTIQFKHRGKIRSVSLSGQAFKYGYTR